MKRPTLLAAVLAVSLLGALAACANDPLAEQYRSGDNKGFIAADGFRVVEIPADGVFMLHPGEFVLGSTLERITVPDDLVARVDGKSSLGRLGLLIHSTAGMVDPGFDGHITLELANVARLPITLYPSMKIGQLSFMTMTSPAEQPYGKGARGSKYQGQRGPTPSRYFENFRDD